MNVRTLFTRRAESPLTERPVGVKALLGLALAFLAFQLAANLAQFGRTAAAALRYPYPLDYVEGPLLDQVLRLAADEPIYRAELSAPFTVTHNAPVFLALQLPFAWLFGPAYWYGRLLALLGALLAALFLGLTLYQITHDRLPAITAGLTLLAVPYLLHGSLLDQPNSLALALSWAGLWVVVRWPDLRRARNGAAALFTLAVFTQPGYFLAAPLAAAAWLAQTRRARQALELVGVLAGGCLALFLLMNLLTGGGFYFNLVTANPAQFSWKTVTAYIARLLPNLFYLFISTILFLTVERVGDRTETWPLLLPYFAGALVSSSFSGQAGAGERAFFELAASFALAAGAILSWVRNIAWMQIVLVFILALQAGQMLNWARVEFVPRVMARVEVEDEIASLAAQVRSAERPVLADEYNGLLPLAGKRINFQPREFKALREAGLWDENLFIKQVERKSFSMVLLYIPMDTANILTLRWTPAIRNAIWSHYRLTGVLGDTHVYQPKP